MKHHLNSLSLFAMLICVLALAWPAAAQQQALELAKGLEAKELEATEQQAAEQIDIVEPVAPVIKKQEPLVPAELVVEEAQPTALIERQKNFLQTKLKECPESSQLCRDQVQSLLDLLNIGVLAGQSTPHYYLEIWPQVGMGPPRMVEDLDGGAWKIELDGGHTWSDNSTTSAEEGLFLEGGQWHPVPSVHNHTALDAFLIDIFPDPQAHSLRQQLLIGLPEATLGLVISPSLRHKFKSVVHRLLRSHQSGRQIGAIQRALAHIQHQKDILSKNCATQLGAEDDEAVQQQKQELEAQKRDLSAQLRELSRQRSRISYKQQQGPPRYDGGADLKGRMGYYAVRVMTYWGYISVPLVSLEALARLYIWNVVKKDPEKVPLLTIGKALVWPPAESEAIESEEAQNDEAAPNEAAPNEAAE